MNSEETPPPHPPELGKRRRLRKEEIVAEATRLFAERGYEGTSMGDLAERVGLRKASLFHHFESKDSLYATVLGQLLDRVGAAIAGATSLEGTCEQRLDALSEALTGILGAQSCAARLLFREAMDWGPVMREQLAGRVQTLLSAAEEFAKFAQREGVFSAELDAKHIVLSLIGIYFVPFVLGRTVEQFVGKSPYEAPFIEDRKRAIRDHIRALALCPARA